MRKIKLGLVGFGTVGLSTFNILERNGEHIKRRLGTEVKFTAVCIRDPQKRNLIKNPSIEVYSDPIELIERADIDIVVELIGGVSAARRIVETAIQNQKHIVTANKELIATCGNELFKLAESKGVMLVFEAAVAGGIPIVKSLREGLAANKIEWIAGIINGTTNYILSEMQTKRVGFEVALNGAMERGYAEQDPTFDIEGIDSAHKLAIMASLAFGIKLQFKKIFCEGITGLEIKDIEYAEKFGYKIKLLGIAKRRNSGIELRVHPCLVPENSVIANINGAMNGVLVHGDAVGPTLHYGAGAGGEATASAVLADVIDVSRLHMASSDHYVPYTAYRGKTTTVPVLSIDEIKTSYYLRVKVKDQVGVMAEVTRVLAELSISIEAMFQGESLHRDSIVEVVIITHETLEGDIRRAISQIEVLAAVNDKINFLRIENLDIT